MRVYAWRARKKKKNRNKANETNKKTSVFFLIIALLSFAIDQVTKYYVFGILSENGDAIILIPNVLAITRSVNTGGAFGLFPNSALILTILAFPALVFVLYLLYKSPYSGKFFYTGLALFTGGILGNVYDRIIFGKVRDFITVSVWPTFNFADAFLCVGMAMIFLVLLLHPKTE